MALLKKLNSKHGLSDFNMLPWARGYNDVQNNKNTALFATFRSKSRENLFKWAGPLTVGGTVIVAKKSSNIKISSPEDIKKHKIGALIADMSQQALNNLGITDDLIDLVHSNAQNKQKLDSGKIDLMSVNEFKGMKSIFDSGSNPDDYESVYLFDEYDLDIAFNKQTDDRIIKQIQDALDSLKVKNSPNNLSEYDMIMRKYQQ